MKALERDSNYLHAHGSYLDDWRITLNDQPVVRHACFRRVMLVTGEVARHMIAEAMAGVDVEDYGALFGDDAARKQARERAWDVNNQPSAGSWMMPGNKEFVLFRLANAHAEHPLVFGIYQHDYRTYLIEGEVRLIRQFISTGPLPDRRPRLMAALDGNFTETIPESQTDR